MRATYFQRENRELVNLDSCELIHSQFSALSDYGACVALDYFAEVSEQLLPAGEANERHFRLLLAVLEQMRSEQGGKVWRAATYFSLWAARLGGFLPDLEVCMGCGAWLSGAGRPERAFFHFSREGLLCEGCRRGHASGRGEELSAGSRALAAEMLRTPIGQLSKTEWVRETAADLRRLLAQHIERHIERKLITFPVLESV